MIKKTIDSHQLDEILASYEYYRLANTFKKITSVSQDEIEEKGYSFEFITSYRLTHEDVLKDTLQFVYMMLTDFCVGVELIKNDDGITVNFNTAIDKGDLQPVDLFQNESTDDYLNKKSYSTIGNISFQKRNSQHPSGCMGSKMNKNSSLETLSYKIIDFLATYPIIFYLNDNEEKKPKDICKQIDDLANKYFSEHILSGFKKVTVTNNLLNHCQKVLKKDKVIISAEVSFNDKSKKIVQFHRQLAEDIYYSIIYELIDLIQTEILKSDEGILNCLHNKISNDKSGHRRIEKYFFSTQNRRIDEYLKKIDAREEEMKRFHLEIASQLKFFS